MQRATLAALFVITTVLATSPAEAQRGRRGRGNTNVLEQNCWLTDYNKAKSIASRTGQPMMVVFRCVP